MSEDGPTRAGANAGGQGDVGGQGNEAVRAGLIAGIKSRRREFESAGERAEELRAMPADAIATLREMGAFWLKTPAEFGGTPLTPLEFCDVMEEIGYADTTTAWVTMVGNGGTGTAAGWLPDAGARAVFAPGRPLPLIVGVPRAAGTRREALSGRRSMCSCPTRSRRCASAWPGARSMR